MRAANTWPMDTMLNPCKRGVVRELICLEHASPESDFACTVYSILQALQTAHYRHCCSGRLP